jgi:hypothetical protein
MKFLGGVTTGFGGKAKPGKITFQLDLTILASWNCFVVCTVVKSILIK